MMKEEKKYIVIIHYGFHRSFTVIDNIKKTKLSAYRADWEPEAPSGRRALGVFWRCPAVLWGPSTPNPTQVSWKPLILKNWPIFSRVMWICGGFSPRGPSALLATKKASFGIKTCHSAIPRIMGQKIADF